MPLPAPIPVTAENLPAAEPSKGASGATGVMLIERVTLYELNIDLERKRLAGNFKGNTLKALSSILEAFVELNWDRARELCAALKEGQVEYLHPVIYESLSQVAARNRLREQAKGQDLQFNEGAALMGGTTGSPCSPDGLHYPKFQTRTAVF